MSATGPSTPAAPAPPPADTSAPPPGPGPAAGTLERWAPRALVLFALVAGALASLYEMDLGQHLAGGQWIASHHAVPFVEPFAWTRAGQPYFAYSWLPETVYYLLLRAFGPLALHLLQGALAAGAAAAALWAGRRLGWPPRARLLVAALHVALLWGISAALRPEQLLFVTLPLCWGVAALVAARGVSARRLLALAGLGALTANSHLFFPLTAVPVLFFLAARGDVRRWLPALAALVVGWLLSPYGLAWPRVFALNFGHNVLLGRPSSIREFLPGFEYWFRQWGVLEVVVALLGAAWLVAAEPDRPRRERLVLAAGWAVGLLLFAYAGRLALVWWALSFPLVGLAAERALRLSDGRLRRPAWALASPAAAALLLIAAAPTPRPAAWAYEGDATYRMLPRALDEPALWLPSWLLCHTRPGASGRVFTEFNYGSELDWRLPGYSMSIDGRTIFPDSDAADFAYVLYGARRHHATTWKHADLVLVDWRFWLAPIVNDDPAWVRLAESGAGWHAGAALWARRSWWQRWGDPTADLPALGLMPGDPRGSCSAAGVFPRR